MFVFFLNWSMYAMHLWYIHIHFVRLQFHLNIDKWRHDNVMTLWSLLLFLPHKHIQYVFSECFGQVIYTLRSLVSVRIEWNIKWPLNYNLLLLYVRCPFTVTWNCWVNIELRWLSKNFSFSHRYSLPFGTNLNA